MSAKRIHRSEELPPGMVSTLLVPPPGYVLVKQLGLVNGVTVRSRNALAALGAGFKAMAGGRIDTFKVLCEDARMEAYNFMIEEAVKLGANAIIGVHYGTGDLEPGITEVVCYGTAVTVEKQ